MRKLKHRMTKKNPTKVPQVAELGFSAKQSGLNDLKDQFRPYQFNTHVLQVYLITPGQS